MSYSEQIMSKDKYPSIFSRQMEAIVYIFLRQMEAIVYINTSEILSELLRVNMIFLHVGSSSESFSYIR